MWHPQPGGRRDGAVRVENFPKVASSTRADEEGESSEEISSGLHVAFREIFSRPVRRIRFLGLFDTVNSVPAFETRFMERSKFPYTTHTMVKVIRHAVSIDERRSQFRQDQVKHSKDHTYCRRFQHLNILQEEEELEDKKLAVKNRGRQESKMPHSHPSKASLSARDGVSENFRDRSETYG